MCPKFGTYSDQAAYVDVLKKLHSDEPEDFKIQNCFPNIKNRLMKRF